VPQTMSLLEGCGNMSLETPIGCSSRRRSSLARKEMVLFESLGHKFVK
jgi:hypothetical protein